MKSDNQKSILKNKVKNKKKLMQPKNKFLIEVDLKNLNQINMLMMLRKVGKNQSIYKIKVKFQKGQTKKEVSAKEVKQIVKMVQKVKEKVITRKVK